MKTLITGASGFIGGRLGEALEQNHELYALSRRKGTKVSFKSTVVTPEDLPHLEGVEAIVNFAGASIAAQRWTESYKKVLRESRIGFTKKILSALDLSELQVLVQASAVGVYKPQGDEVITEDSPADESFLAQLVLDWEAASEKLEAHKVYLRQGMVLGKNAPAVNKMEPLFKNRVGAVLGDGQQNMSWVHVDDVVQIVKESLETKKYKGIYNMVSPNPINNKDFTTAFSKAMGRKQWAPAVPEVALKLAYGEMSQVLLDSQKCRPQRLIEEGYEFKYESVLEALKDSTS